MVVRERVVAEKKVKIGKHGGGGHRGPRVEKRDLDNFKDVLGKMEKEKKANKKKRKNVSYSVFQI